MPFLSLLAFSLLCWLSDASAVRAAQPSPPPPVPPIPPAIWSGLVLATNNPKPAQAPTPLRQFAGKLKNIFGYNQFELVGENSEIMDDPYERWLTPSKDFCLSVKTHNEPAQHYPTKVVLFQNRRRLAEFETHLNSESPLFIRGPLYAGGQLVIILHVVDAAAAIPPRTPRPALLPATPLPVSIATSPREKEKDRFNPMPLQRAGALDSKFNKP